MQKYQTNIQSESGFTLFEMTVVVIVGGILLAFFGATLTRFMHENRVNTTEYRLERVMEALTDYLSANARYPCPANRTLGPSNANFGRQVTTNCNAGIFPGTQRVGPAGSRVRIGAVPTRTLNLPDDFLADAWGRKFSYAVTESLATPLQYRADGGQVIVHDDVGTEVVNNAHYFLFSHGVTGDGGFPLGPAAQPVIRCPLPAENSLDRENCDDNDNIFRRTLVNAETTLAGFYDDYAYFKGLDKTHLIAGIPTGAVMAFDNTPCPEGWVNFAQAEGRMLVGAQPTVKNMTTFVYRFKQTAPTTRTFNLAPEQTAEDVEANMPPFIALNYCEKLPL